MTEWRDIPGFEGLYLVSDEGQLYSVRRKKAIKAFDQGDGYLISILKVNKVSQNMPVHRAVGEAFLGPLPEGMVTRHLDGTRTNNTLANLRYGTAKENAEDRTRHGRSPGQHATHCSEGHEINEANTHYKPGTMKRRCRPCTRVRYREMHPNATARKTP